MTKTPNSPEAQPLKGIERTTSEMADEMNREDTWTFEEAVEWLKGDGVLIGSPPWRTMNRMALIAIDKEMEFRRTSSRLSSPSAAADRRG